MHFWETPNYLVSPTQRERRGLESAGCSFCFYGNHRLLDGGDGYKHRERPWEEYGGFLRTDSRCWMLQPRLRVTFGCGESPPIVWFRTICCYFTTCISLSFNLHYLGWEKERHRRNQHVFRSLSEKRWDVVECMIMQTNHGDNWLSEVYTSVLKWGIKTRSHCDMNYTRNVPHCYPQLPFNY